MNSYDIEIHAEFGDPGGARTPNPLLRRQVLYPVELRDRRSHPTLRRGTCKSRVGNTGVRLVRQ